MHSPFKNAADRAQFLTRVIDHTEKFAHSPKEFLKVVLPTVAAEAAQALFFPDFAGELRPSILIAAATYAYNSRTLVAGLMSQIREGECSPWRALSRNPAFSGAASHSTRHTAVIAVLCCLALIGVCAVNPATTAAFSLRWALFCGPMVFTAWILKVRGNWLRVARNLAGNMPEDFGMTGPA